MASVIKDVMQIECQAETAFDLMADPRNELEWNSGVSEAELISEGPIGKGSRFRIKDSRGEHEVEITTYKRPNRLGFWAKDKSMNVSIDFDIGYDGKATTMVGKFNAVGSGLMKFILPVLIPLIRRQIAKEHKNFIAMCESRSSARPA
jgi:hypothetical protein